MDWTEYLVEGNDYVSVKRWGQDHWSTLAYLETRATDAKGVIDNRRMRCNSRLHRHFVYRLAFTPVQDGSKYPTRLNDGELDQHDDWSCLEDMVKAGLLRAWYRDCCPSELFGGYEARIELTDTGRQVANILRGHKASHGKYSTFRWQHARTKGAR